MRNKQLDEKQLEHNKQMKYDTVKKEVVCANGRKVIFPVKVFKPIRSKRSANPVNCLSWWALYY